MWPFKRRPTDVPDDLHEAKALREISTQQLQQVQQRGPQVAQMAAFLAERRRANHFGESIQITFTRRA